MRARRATERYWRENENIRIRMARVRSRECENQRDQRSQVNRLRHSLSTSSTKRAYTRSLFHRFAFEYLIQKRLAVKRTVDYCHASRLEINESAGMCGARREKYCLR